MDYMLLFILCVNVHIINGHYDKAYFRNGNDAFIPKKKWMSEIQDDVFLSELAIPGTHDSAAFSGSDSVATQCLNFAEQLDYGIRYFDIRIKHVSNKFPLYRGHINMGVTFDEFLQSVTNFLSNNPTEVVLFRLKEEQPFGDGNTRRMRDTLEEYLKNNSDYFLETNDRYMNLNRSRGKFIILSDYSDFHKYGLIYSALRDDIQDEFHLSTNWDLYCHKWKPIEQHLEKAIRGNQNKFYVNYLSGSGGSFPYFVASGHSSPGTSAPRLSTGLTTPLFKDSYPDFPRVTCFIGICTIAFEGTNILTRDKIQKYNELMKTNEGNYIDRTVGIITADFPGESLIQTIIDNNFKLRK